jgi:hypothetical protein
MINLEKKDVERLRELGKIVKEYAEDPINEKHKKIWTAVNDRQMITPAVIARDYPKYLIDYNDELNTVINDPFFRHIEFAMLLEIYEWRHMRCNRVIENIIYCPVAYGDRRYGIWASTPYPEKFTAAVVFDRQIQTEDDVNKILDAYITYDEKTTMERLGQMREIFDGILRVKLHGADNLYFSPWDDILSWMNIQDGMYEFADNPELMKKAVRRYVDVSISRAKRCEELGILSSNNRNIVIAAGGYGYTSELPPPTESGIGAKLIDIWGDGRDQIFTAVSPEMCEEFAFDFEKPWTDLFGLNYYGCCEDMNKKIKTVSKLTRLRKLTLPPASYYNIEAMMEEMGKDIVVSFKPNPTYLSTTPLRMDLAREELINGCKLARKYNCSMEILMKTMITLENDPTRLWDWCKMATEIAGDY